MADKTKRSNPQTPRRKGHLPAKSGKRHLVNPRHPHARPLEQQAMMQKKIR